MARSTFPMSARRTIPTLGSLGGFRTFLAVPLRQQGEFIGALTARRIEVRPFTPAQIKLLETFADQAVIAIENVRLFKSSRNRWSSKRRRAKSWASSPARRRIFSRCLDTIAESAARLCDASELIIHRVDGDVLQLVAALRTDAVLVGARHLIDRRDHLPAEPCSIGKRFISMIWPWSLKLNFPEARLQDELGIRTVSGDAVASRRSRHRCDS